MSDEDLKEIIGMLGYQTELPEEQIKTIRSKALAVDKYLTKIGVPKEEKKGEMYLQTIALGVNDLMEDDSDGFSGLFERMSLTLR